MLGPWALFVVSDKITVDHLNRVLADEASYEVYSLVPVVEPDLLRPYSASPRRPYDSRTGKELPPTQHPPPVSPDLLAPANNPFIGATIESCAAYLRASASASTAWDTHAFAVLDEGYITHGTVLVAHSYVAGDDKNFLDWMMPTLSGVQAWPCEKGMVVGYMTLRTGIDFQEDLWRYQALCKSRGVEDRSVGGLAWELFQPQKEEEREEEKEEDVLQYRGEWMQSRL